MSNFRMRIDISRCIGCRACEVACVTANDLNPGVSRNWVPYLEANQEAGSHAVFAPYLCHQCEEPPCVPACPTGASFIAADGRVLVDRDLCIGCGMCVAPCPYQARRNDPVASKLEKCDLCEGRVAAGLAPACFSTCPAGARIFEEEVVLGGRKQLVSVGSFDEVDPGCEVIRLVTADSNPKPRLNFSGRREDLELLREARPPRNRVGSAGALWSGGTGFFVRFLGYASMTAMGAMIALRTLRSRKQEVAAEESRLAPGAMVSKGDEEAALAESSPPPARDTGKEDDADE